MHDFHQPKLRQIRLLHTHIVKLLKHIQSFHNSVAYWLHDRKQNRYLFD